VFSLKEVKRNHHNERLMCEKLALNTVAKNYINASRRGITEGKPPQILACAPRLFTKILKPVYAMLHQMGRPNVGYITDSYLQGENREDCQANISDTCDLFSKLGFILHLVKSVLKPVQVLTFLGFVLNLVDTTVSLTREKSSTLR